LSPGTDRAGSADPDPAAPDTSGADPVGPPASPLPGGVLIRPGVRAEVEAIRDVEVDAGRRFGDVGLPEVAEDEPPSAAELGDAIDGGLLWVAVEGDEVVGYARALDLDGQPHLEQLSVRSGHGGRGIGTALIEVVAGWARRRGGTTLTLSTFRDVAFNGPLYARRGFRVLAPEELDERFLALRAHEADLGLDVTARVVMRRDLT